MCLCILSDLRHFGVKHETRTHLHTLTVYVWEVNEIGRKDTARKRRRTKETESWTECVCARKIHCIEPQVKVCSRIYIFLLFPKHIFQRASIDRQVEERQQKIRSNLILLLFIFLVVLFSCWKNSLYILLNKREETKKKIVCVCVRVCGMYLTIHKGELLV